MPSAQGSNHVITLSRLSGWILRNRSCENEVTIQVKISYTVCLVRVYVMYDYLIHEKLCAAKPPSR